MNTLFSLNHPMQSIFWPKDHSLIKQLLLIALGVTLLAFASQLSIPLEPVPLTFQSTAVVLIGMAYGARQGAYVIAAYFLAGACGLPIFADFHAGPAVFVGPTGGYLVGLLPAAFLSGYLAQKGWGKHIISSFAAALLGVTLIFCLGLTWLSQSVGWHQAIIFGLMPFVLSETLKLMAVSYVIPKLWKN